VGGEEVNGEVCGNVIGSSWRVDGWVDGLGGGGQEKLERRTRSIYPQFVVLFLSRFRSYVGDDLGG
jgi:hypothetical protein